MFLKVKRAGGKQYFALCESVRRDKKIVTKTIRSLGNEEKALLILQSDYPEFLDRYHEIVGTKKCRDNSVSGALEIVKRLVINNDYGHLLKNDTKVCLSRVHNRKSLCQISVILLNDDVMTYLTIRKHDTSFVGWEITPTTNKIFDYHRQNHFTKNENGLYVLDYRPVKKVVSEFLDWLDAS